MGVRCSIFPNDLRYQILADDGAECDVGNWDADDKADDLNELSRLRNGSPPAPMNAAAKLPMTSEISHEQPIATTKKSSHALK